MRKRTPKNPAPIPTEYSGRRFRSRFEASVAQLLDLIGLTWKYESRSFLIGPGLHYCPDFYVPEQNLWIEARGYHSASADRQVELFLEYCQKNGWHYLVLSPDGCSYDGQPARISRTSGRWKFSNKEGQKLTVTKSTIMVDKLPAHEAVTGR